MRSLSLVWGRLSKRISQDELSRPVVAVPYDQQPVRPAHRNIEGVKDVERLALGAGIEADRLRLKRKLLHAKAVAHALQHGARLFANFRLRLAGGFRRAEGDRDEASDAATDQDSEKCYNSQLHRCLPRHWLKRIIQASRQVWPGQQQIWSW